MTSIKRPDGGDHTAHEDQATKWPRCVGTGGRDASESVAAIVGMRNDQTVEISIRNTPLDLDLPGSTFANEYVV